MRDSVPMLREQKVPIDVLEVRSRPGAGAASGEASSSNSNSIFVRIGP